MRQERTRRRRFAGVALAGAVLVTATGVAAATPPAVLVRTDGSTVERVVVDTISPEAVVCQGQTVVPCAELKELRFEAAPLPCKQTGVVLRTGEVLGGVLRKLSPQGACFRSVTFGELNLPRAALAVVYYLPEAAAEPVAAAPAHGQGVLVRRDGTEVAGDLLWADTRSAGLLTAVGLVTVPAAAIRRVVLAAVADPVAGMVLRNRDRLVRLVNEPGVALAVDLAGNRLPVSLEAVQVIRFDPRVHTEKP